MTFRIPAIRVLRADATAANANQARTRGSHNPQFLASAMGGIG